MVLGILGLSAIVAMANAMLCLSAGASLLDALGAYAATGTLCCLALGLLAMPFGLHDDADHRK